MTILSAIAAICGQLVTLSVLPNITLQIVVCRLPIRKATIAWGEVGVKVLCRLFY